MSDVDFFRKQFLNYLRLEKSLSENTVSNYLFDLDRFINYLRDEHSVDNVKSVTDKIVESYLYYLRNMKSKTGGYYSIKSINRHISSLKTFFKYLLAEKNIDSNPTDIIDPPKSTRKLPDVLTIQEIDKMFMQTDLNDKYELRTGLLWKLCMHLA